MPVMNQDIAISLSANGRRTFYTYKLLDYEENERTGITLKVKKATVKCSSLDDLKQYAEVTMLDNSSIDYDNDRLQIFCNIEIPKQGVYTYSLGIYLMSAPRTEIGSSESYKTISCYGKNKLLIDERVQTPYRLAKGANVRNAIIGLLGTHQYVLPASTAVMPSDKEYEAGSTKLSIINSLLSDYMGCTSLYVTTEGLYTARQYVLPINRAIEHTYSNQNNTCLEARMQQEIDTFSIPNRFNSYTSSSNETSLSYSYTNTNAESKTSTTNRHGRIVDEERVCVDCTTLAELEEATKKRANEASSTYSKLTWYTKVLPIHGFLDCCYVSTDKVQGKYIETSWSIDSTSNSMEHQGRKAVSV